MAAGAAAVCVALVLGLSPMAGAGVRTHRTGQRDSSGSGGDDRRDHHAGAEHDRGQRAVTWTPTTTFTETATQTISAVAVGDCLMVVGSPAKKSKTTIAARTVTISKPSASGTCTGGIGGGAGFGGGAAFGGGRGRSWPLRSEYERIGLGYTRSGQLL